MTADQERLIEQARANDVAFDNYRAFFEAARWQGVCAVCERPGGDWEAHHVVQKQVCRREHAPQHSPDNALRVCERDHVNHTNAVARIPLGRLRNENIAWARRWLGPELAYNYLSTQYGGPPDARIDRLLEQSFIGLDLDPVLRAGDAIITGALARLTVVGFHRDGRVIMERENGVQFYAEWRTRADLSGAARMFRGVDEILG
jgi:hypothetical protein